MTPTRGGSSGDLVAAGGVQSPEDSLQRAAGRRHHEHARRPGAEVAEAVRHAPRKMDEGARSRDRRAIGAVQRDLAFEDVEKLILVLMHMQRHAKARRHRMVGEEKLIRAPGGLDHDRGAEHVDHGARARLDNADLISLMAHRSSPF